LKDILQFLFFGKLAKASTWLFAGGLLSGFLGYFFQIIVGRMLSVSDYGAFNSLMALIMLVGAPLITLMMLVSRKVSSYRSSSYDNHRAHLFYIANFYIVIILTLFSIIAVSFFEIVIDFLSLENNIHLYLLIAMLFVAFPQAVNNAYLQGLQFFKWLAFTGVLFNILKIILVVVLIYLGFGVSGALGGVILASIIVFLITFIALLPSLRGNKSKYNSGYHFSIKSIIPVLLANIAFALMTQIDMVLVRHFFLEQEAGLYAAASILGKAVMYLPGGIAMALFPMVAGNHSDGKTSSHLLLQAFGITLILCTIGSLFYYYFSDLIIVLLYGEDYKMAAPILKYFGFAMIPMGLILVAEHFLIAMGKVLFAYLFIIIAPLQLIAIYYFHDTLLNIVLIMFISGIILTILGYSLLWRAYRNGRNK